MRQQKQEKSNVKETFFEADNSNTSRSCPSLLKHVSDENVKKRLEHKFKTVKNDGKTFLGFRNKNKPYVSDYEYCFINTFDHTNSRNPVPCNKDTAAYDYAMINSVNVGTIHEPGDVYPRDVCIMEIDKDKIETGDVMNMSEEIDRHDNQYLMKTIDEYKETNRKLSSQIHSLEDINQELQNNQENMNDSLQSCLDTKSDYLRQKIMLKAENDTFKNKVVVLDLDKFFDMTHEDDQDEVRGNQKWLSFHTQSDNPKVNVPLSFNITHIYVPRGKLVRLTRKNGSFIDFGQSSQGYPLTKNIDTFNTVRVSLLS